MDYMYPRIENNGYRWHLGYKCFLLVGRSPVSSGDTAEETFMRFEPPLTEDEKVKIDDLMIQRDKVLLPFETHGTILEIQDFFEVFNDFQSRIGNSCSIWFVKSDPDIERCDRIEIRFNKTLNDTELMETIHEYSKLIRVKQRGL